MAARFRWLLLGILCCGCQVLIPHEAGGDLDAAERFWQLGQDAMKRNEPDEAISCYERSLTADPHLGRNYLSIAAAHLAREDEAAACASLTQYVSVHPEHVVIRAHLAELLLKLHREEEARTEFERFIALAQENAEPDHAKMIHCNRRLMEIAEAAEDAYSEHLYRGIGLYLLARQRAALPEQVETLPVEGLLCKAAAELTLAHQVQPDLARPSWYLYEVWTRLAQRQPALRSLRATEEAAPFSYLTPVEHRRLELALQQQQTETLVK